MVVVYDITIRAKGLQGQHIWVNNANPDYSESVLLIRRQDIAIQPNSHSLIHG